MALLTLVVIAIYQRCCTDPFSRLDFDEHRWKSEHQKLDPDSLRGGMVQALRDQHLRMGMTRAEVLKLLGPPDGDQEFARLSYMLGMYSGFRIDYDSLDLEFDGNTDANRLVKIHVVQH